ncbi:MAG: outer membrane protein assembly factor BamD [Mariniblastus sp.]|nr:outer membrane protein assembly factor BamD [Mariniblastus sp.]
MRFRFTLRICACALLVPLFGGCQTLNLDFFNKQKKPDWGATSDDTSVDPDEILDPLGRRQANRLVLDDLAPSQIATTLATKTVFSEDPEAARDSFAEGKAVYEQALQQMDEDPDSGQHIDTFAKAANHFRIASSQWPDSQLDQEALFWQADSFFFADRYVQANRAYEALLVKYPGSDYMDKAEARRFAIAQYWLELSEVDGAFALTDPSRPKKGVKAEARRILHRIRLNDPTGKFADDATLALATAYFKEEMWLDAGDTYEDLRLNYPGSPHQFHAHLFELKARLNAYRGKSYSADPLIRADKLMQQIVKSFPNEIASEREYLAQEAALIRHKLAERDWSMAQYYLKKGENRAAQVYLGKLTAEFDDTAYAEAALEERENLVGLPDEPDQPAEWFVNLFPDSESKVKPIITARQNNTKTR